MSATDKVIGSISPSEPWGLSTDVQSLVEYLGQAAHVALSDLHVQTWTAKSADELAALKTILNELHTKLLITLATADALDADFKRQA